jgi:hypothetical protein
MIPDTVLSVVIIVNASLLILVRFYAPQARKKEDPPPSSRRWPPTDLNGPAQEMADEEEFGPAWWMGYEEGKRVGYEWGLAEVSCNHTTSSDLWREDHHQRQE